MQSDTLGLVVGLVLCLPPFVDIAVTGYSLVVDGTGTFVMSARDIMETLSRLTIHNIPKALEEAQGFFRHLLRASVPTLCETRGHIKNAFVSL